MGFSDESVVLLIRVILLLSTPTGNVCRRVRFEFNSEDDPPHDLTPDQRLIGNSSRFNLLLRLGRKGIAE